MNYTSTNFKGNVGFYITLKLFSKLKSLLLLLLLVGQFGFSNAQSGSALSFDGSNDYVAVNNPFTAFQKEITVEWWVYIVPGQTYTLGSGIGQGTVGIDDMNNNVWLMHFNGSGSSLQFYVNDAGVWRTHSAVNIPSGWHHLAGVADANATRLFIDGVQAGSTGPGISTGIWSNANAKIHFGKDVRFNTNRFMPGIMDEIRIWSRAICQGELQNNKFCEIPSAAPNLEGNYHFNQGIAGANNTSVTTLLDASGNGRHGTLINMDLTNANSNWVTPGGIVNGTVCSPFAYPSANINAAGSTTFCNGESVTLSANTNASFTYQWKRNNINIPGATSSTYSATTAGNYTVEITNLGCSSVSNAITVTVYTADADNDGVADVCDSDDDNDGIPDAAECTQSNFFWSNPPVVNGTQATGTINGIVYKYTSSSPIEVTSSVYAHNVFPSSYGVPNVNPTIKNTQITNNTLTFDAPMTNPVLVFASIGNGTTSVPIRFSTPVQIVWSQNVVQNNPTQITGTEGYAIVRLNGTFSSINFDYLVAENWCNFAFGADFRVCLDTDNDGITNERDIDSDNDGCADAIEGNPGFSLAQTTNGRLNGGVNNLGIPLIAGNGQGIGTSQAAVANCFCQPTVDKTGPTVLTKNLSITLTNANPVNITAAQINNGSNDACGIQSISISKSSFGCNDVGSNSVTLTVTDINGNSTTGTAVVTVIANDTDGDGIFDPCDLDDDNDGILDVTECNKSNFYWSNAPAINSNGTSASGTINGIPYTYSSSSAITTTPGVYAHNVFPSSYGVPNVNPTIQNIQVTNNTLTFTSPMTNPVLVFASIGNGNTSVPITFSSPVQILWSQSVVQNSPTQITGTEGYAIIRLNGTFSSISFNYLVAENWCNFAFGADFTSCGDTDNDGTPDYADLDSDNDGCSDAVEGSMGFLLTQTTNNKLNGAVNAQGVPLLAGAGQGNGASQSSSVNCFCQPNIDRTLPVVITKNITVPLDANGLASISAAAINNGSTDACGIASMTVSKTIFNCTNLGANTVTLTVTDVNGNVATGNAIVTVTDVNAPFIVCSSNIFTNATSASGKVVNYSMPAYTDNCSATISLVSGLPSGSTFPIGTTTVTYRAVDPAGNTRTCSFNVVVTGVAPVIVSPGNITVNTSNGLCSGVANYAATETTGIPASTITYSTAPGSTFNVGSTAVTATATNAIGSSSVTFNVIVVDNQAPNAIAKNLNINLDANGNASINAADVNNGSNDACGIASISINKSSFNCSNVGSNTVTLTVTDVNGNSSTATSTVTVSDNITPTITCGSNIDVFATSAAGAVVNYALPTYGDNCSATISLTSGLVSGSTFPIGTTTVTYNVVDPSGNTATCSFDVTVTGIPPVIVSPGNITANTNNGLCSGVANYAATETTGIPASTITYSIAPGSTFNVGTTQVTATATNAVGTSSVTFDVTIVDAEAPNAIAQNLSIDLDASGNASINAADVNNGSNDACGIASISIDKSTFNCSNVGANTVTLTVTDVNGNSSSTTSTVTVNDVTAPIAIAKNVTVNLANGTASVTAAQINNGSNDACGIASLSLDKSTFDCSNIGANPVVLTVTDVNGNVSYANAIVTVQGFISTCSITATANNSGIVIGGTLTGAAPNQMYIGYGAQSMRIACTAVTGGPFTYKWYGDGLSNTTIANPIFTPTAGGNYTLTCEVTNSSGCVTYCSIEICVFDIRAVGSSAKNPKVYLCHVPPGNSNNPQTLNISISAVPAHLGNHAGDRLGSCNMVCGADVNVAAEGDIYTFENATEEIDLVVYPNPSTSKFTFVLESASTEEVMINIFDITGRKVLEINNKMANEKIELGDELISGTYLAEVVQGSNRKTIKIVKLN